MNSECASLADQLYLVAGGDAEPELQERVRAHTEACAGCAARLREIQRLRQVYFESAHRTSAESVELWGGLRDRLQAEGLLGSVRAPRVAVEPAAVDEGSGVGVADHTSTAGGERRASIAVGSAAPFSGTPASATPSNAAFAGAGAAGGLLQGRFGEGRGLQHRRALVGLLSGAAAGALLFALAGGPQTPDKQTPGESGARVAGGSLASGSAGTGSSSVRGLGEPGSSGASVLDGPALEREAQRLSDEAWLAQGDSELRIVRPGDPDPFAEVGFDTLESRTPTTLPAGRDQLVGAPLQLQEWW